MTLHAHVTREIAEGPTGPRVAALFDVDGTLIAGFSAVAFLRDRVTSGRMGLGELGEALLASAQFGLGRLGFSGLIAATARWLANVPEQELEELAERIFARDIAAAIYPEAHALVRAHRHMGHTLALVSSATRYQIEPLARELGIPHVLCTRLEVADGFLTGRHVTPTCWGEGKAIAARSLAAEHDLDLTQSYFYSDSHEDLPLLEIVGRPRPTNPTRRLEEFALRRAWPIQRFTNRGLPGLLDIVRTTLALGSIVPSLALGAAPGLLNLSRRDAVNLAIATWGELGTALAGIQVTATGEEHLWSHRPAVFIFNHQSAIDVLILAKLLRRDFVGIAKKEVRRHPILGPAFAFAGTVFIDRYDRERAIQALAPAVDALRSGLSLVIAPEGTRSATTRLGSFKKGAFHLAMRAGVPLVPIVIRNALDAMPKHALVARPATVEVSVLPPVDTRTWRVAGLDDHIGEVREMFVRTLDS